MGLPSLDAAGLGDVVQKGSGCHEFPVQADSGAVERSSKEQGDLAHPVTVLHDVGQHFELPHEFAAAVLVRQVHSCVVRVTARVPGLLGPRFTQG